MIYKNKIKFYNINDVHILGDDLDEEFILYKSDNFIVYKDILNRIAVISLKEERYDSIEQLPDKIKDILLKEAV